MHGLINRAIERFVRDTYGAHAWAQIARRAGLDFAEFEAMLIYEPTLTHAVLAAAAEELERPAPDILEDIGTYLVSHPNVEALRRLLRFGGETFTEFLYSLDDLPERARLAVSDLDLPRLELREEGADRYSLVCRGETPGFGHVVMGLLRAMADDYGALVVLDHKGAVDGGAADGAEVIDISLLTTEHAAGRRFDLAARVG